MNVLLALAMIAPAQEPTKQKEPKPVAGFGFPADSEFYWPTHLLTSPDVQKVLKLTKEQLTQLNGMIGELKKTATTVAGLTPPMAKKYVNDMTAWAEKSLASLLTDEQRVRHRQILWQVMEFNGGVRGMTADPVFAKEVGLSADQHAKARKIEADYLAGWQKLVRANPAVGNGPVPGEEALAKKAEDAAMKLLTADQKKRWNELLGEPFKGDIMQFPIPGIRPVKFQAPEKK